MGDTDMGMVRCGATEDMGEMGMGVVRRGDTGDAAMVVRLGRRRRDLGTWGWMVVGPAWGW